MPSDTRNVKLGVCRVYYDNIDLGYTQGGVVFSVETETHKVQVDQFGKTTVSERITGRNCKVEAPLAESTIDNLVAVMPGATKIDWGGGKISLTVKSGTSIGLLDLAKRLVLHPTNKPLDDNSEDLVIPIAATSGQLSYKYKIDEERVFPVEFAGYPDPESEILFYFGGNSSQSLAVTTSGNNPSSFYLESFELDDLSAIDDSVETAPSKATDLLTPSYLDPVSNVKVFRATEPADFPTGSFIRHEYSRRQAFNSNNTRFIAQASNGFWLLYDAATFQVLTRGRPNGALLGMAGDCEAFWDATDPEKLIYTSNNGGMTYWEKNVETDTDTVAFSFTGRLPSAWSGTTSIWSKSEGTPSADGRYFGFMATSYNSSNQSNVIHGIFCYDRQTDTILGTLDPVDFDSNFPDHISMSPSGEYVIPSWAFNATLGTRAYSRDFSSNKQIITQSEHSDLALNASGQDIFIAADYGQNNIIAYNLQTDEVWNIIGLYPRAGSTIGAVHISGKCYDVPGWALISTYADSSGYGSVYPDATLEVGQRSLFLVELVPTGARMLFVCHTRAKANYGGYFGEHQATISRDASRAIFATNFDDGGVPSDYVVLLPDFTDDGTPGGTVSSGSGGGSGGTTGGGGSATPPTYAPAFVLPNLIAVNDPVLTKPSGRATDITSESYTDPVTGALVYRVTLDNNQDFPTGSHVRHYSSTQQAFNSDNTRFIVQSSDGYWLLYNATTFVRLRRSRQDGGLINMTADCEPIWHPTDPAKLWFTDPYGGLKWYEKNVETDIDTEVMNFTTGLPWAGATKVYMDRKGSPSADGRYWGFKVVNGVTPLGIICYDLQTGSIIGSLAASNFSDSLPDHVTMAPSGSYVVAAWGSLGLRAYETDFSSYKQMLSGSPHYDIAIAPNGDDVIVAQDTGQYKLVAKSIQTEVQVDLMSMFPRSGAGIGSFNICGKSFETPGWALVSISGDYSDYGSTSPDATLEPGQRSLVLMSLDGTVKLHVGHVRFKANATIAPNGVISRDGGRVLFTTNFDDGSVGDEYLVLLPNFSV